MAAIEKAEAEKVQVVKGAEADAGGPTLAPIMLSNIPAIPAASAMNNASSQLLMASSGAICCRE